MAVAQDIARTQDRPAPAFWTIARRDSLAGFLFIAPQLIGIVIFVLIPLGLVFWYSLHEWNVLANTFTYTGAQNYRMLVEDDNLRDVLGATAIFSAGLVVFNLSLALLLAVLLNQKLAGIAIFRTLFFSPVVVSLVAWTIVWGFLLQKNGGINGMLLMAGIEGPNWLREETTAMISVIVVQVFKNVGLNMILFLAALQGVPKELYEAARIDGAPAFKQFRRITLPLISPTILLTSIITIVGSLQVFAQIAVLTQGGPGLSTTVLVYYLYQQAFQFHFFGYGSTLSILLFVIVAVLTFAQWQMRKRIVFYES
ncbi:MULTISPECIES: carbohydrate ABC transporter permease [Agrobacterium]|jgi:multiple sugar transport system permease protein|uniref:carbohydrate ABC transporter permease n=1 Tax=Agrobacterium TaxID=357 RepID=UPI00109318B3|nr:MULTISPECIES: sugar ABC transporter permease [Agrobacterium]MDP9753773.1 multiple sugar transport system permease protein [Rhizobium sp. SORGH_AS_0260]TGR68035.1 sugar ABC transporter permease [bacterium M00.F.Ca.ET.194.01.1.1]TGS54136.1 sugar ABC transporter permease [bacterium M00.F.Ca.ET.179.01.1.1]TGV46952.1 sugar ABC transporter permease [bacterium M00.F.Ca.ET.168.01.1.1]MCZ7930567.1 sugar ABC transporter permease [Agrobacterium pusense]